MSPHRLLHLKGPLAAIQAAQAGDVAAWACSTFFGCIALLFGGWFNLVLAILCVAFATLDTTSGTLRAFLSPAEEAEGGKFIRGAARKILHAHLVGAAVLLDLTFMYGIPGTYDVFHDLRPWTRFGLLVFIGYEGRSLIRNISIVRQIPRRFSEVFDALRDGEELKAVHVIDEARTPESVPADRRWTDPKPESEDPLRAGLPVLPLEIEEDR